ncbi:hypothetical protein [Ralstonia syzygii]|uniref:Uncharacterized protein n=1 Tax=Ralstonia syzygii R24 TaxID=907261 RepID=G3A3Z8_9RALS|nr:hypothetical protein [Ralstonia syzygii]CCA88618.1 hypothetical protein RALSY_30368 [Ralstonia syzygii R24]
MLELPRTLVVDDDRGFMADLSQCLVRRSPEMAVLKVATLEDAVRELGDFRPHIVFLNWMLRVQGDLAMGLLRRMSDLMEKEHTAAYRHPFFLHRNWRSEDRESWESLQEVTDSLDNPFKGLRDHEPLEPLIDALYERRIQRWRALKLNGTFIPLGRCAYIRISDPGGIHFWDVGRDCEVTLDRHRKDNFQAISEHLVSSMSVGYPLPGIRSLFVKANERNQWVNLAFTKRIERDTKAVLVFVMAGGAGQVTLTERAAQAVIRTLEYLKQCGCWPHLEHLNLPA